MEVYHSKAAPLSSDTTYINYFEGSPRTASNQRLTIDAHVWTSSFNPLVKYGGLRRCSAIVTSDERSSAAINLFEELAAKRLVL